MWIRGGTRRVVLYTCNRRRPGVGSDRTVPLVKLIVILMLVAIVVSLGSALYQLSRGTGDSGKMLRALTWRISLSVALFILLLVAYSFGLIRPHAITP